MKLRNKKTGEIFDWREDLMPFGLGLPHPKSLAELCNDWEDVKEPLIKDPKIRKAVRAWAEANDKRVFEVQVCYQSYGDGSWSLRDTTHEEDCGLAFIGEIPEGLNLGSRYTIAELCGEEGKCHQEKQ